MSDPSTLRFDALNGRNPLGFLAAIGVLRLISDHEPNARLGWTTDEIVPVAIVTNGPQSFDALRRMLLESISTLRDSPLLTSTTLDIKFKEREGLRQWLTSVSTTALHREMALALVAEGASDGKGQTKPTHLHFSAGQQKFLGSLQEAFDATIADPLRIDEALLGPWRFDSEAKTMGWDAGAERVFALRGFNPSTDKRTGIPAADVFAFIGFSAFPVAAMGGRLRTAACERDWKVSSLTWPLWPSALTIRSAAALIQQPWQRNVNGLLAPPLQKELTVRGVSEVVRSPIRRSDQGGYGSFGAATVIASTTR
jgi:hypothetical protein